MGLVCQYCQDPAKAYSAEELPEVDPALMPTGRLFWPTVGGKVCCRQCYVELTMGEVPKPERPRIGQRRYRTQRTGKHSRRVPKLFFDVPEPTAEGRSAEAASAPLPPSPEPPASR